MDTRLKTNRRTVLTGLTALTVAGPTAAAAQHLDCAALLNQALAQSPVPPASRLSLTSFSESRQLGSVQMTATIRMDTQSGHRQHSVAASGPSQDIAVQALYDRIVQRFSAKL